jgi:DNA polymerase-3 subunit delta'
VTDPRANPLLLGRARETGLLADASRSGRLHHAWLFTGPPGIGKATLAYRFARALLAGRMTPDLALDPADPTFRRVAAGTHADLLVIDRRFDEKKKRLQGEIVIDTVLEAGRFLRLTPGEGGWRVVIVDGAEAMNRNAANALLKLLEEPPARAIWLLVSHAPGRLLPTIRSRCRMLAMDPLPEAVVQELLARANPAGDAAALGRLAALSEGSIGRALALGEEGGLAIAALVDEVLAAKPIAPPRAAAIADAVARAEDGFANFMDMLRVSLAARARQAARGGASPSRMSLDGAARLWQELGRIAAETDGLNLDPRASILTTLQLFGAS